MSLQEMTKPPFSIAARSISCLSAKMCCDGITSPCTRSRATPPSGTMLSRRCVTLLAFSISSSLTVFPSSLVSTSKGSHFGSVPDSHSAEGVPSMLAPSMLARSGKFPVKNVVSITTPRTTPAAPSRIMAQSCPGVRRRRVSHPSIHLPRSVDAPSLPCGACGLSSDSFGAKNSSLAAMTAPPSRSDARSIRSVNDFILDLEDFSSRSLCADSCNIRRLDYPVELHVRVGGQFVPMLRDRVSTAARTFRIPDNDIGIIATGEFSLPAVELHEPRGGRAHPLCNHLRTDSAGAPASPRCGERDLQ